MMVRPPVWSKRAAARAQEEEQEVKRRREEHDWYEADGANQGLDGGDASSVYDIDDYYDEEYYQKLQKDQWTPFECASSFHGAKESLIQTIGRGFARYTLVVYNRPWVFILLSVMVSLLLAIGIPLRRVVQNGERQYALPWTLAYNDSLLYANTFYGNLTRTEVIYVVAHAQDTNLLTREFLDALWTFHLEILSLSVSVKPDEDLIANTTLPPLVFDQLVGGLGMRDPNRRHNDDDLSWRRNLRASEHANRASTATTQPFLATGSRHANLQFSPLTTLNLHFFPPTAAQAVAEDPGLAEVTANTSLAAGSLTEEMPPATDRPVRDEQYALPHDNHGARTSGELFEDILSIYHHNIQRPPEMPWADSGNTAAQPDSAAQRSDVDRYAFPSRGGAGHVQPPQEAGLSNRPVRALGAAGGFGMTDSAMCFEAYAPAKDRVSGLACRPPLPPGQYGFSNLCLKDKRGVCNPPEGVLFMYNDRREFGQPLGYPRHTSWALATETITELWLSQRGMRLNGNGYQVRGTSGFALRYTLADKPHMRNVARAWEAELVKLVEKSKWRLPGASIYCKTDQSLEGDLSSSTGFKGSTDFLFVLAAGALIFAYVGLVTFSTNHFRSKMLVSLMGAVAATLGYCGGAGMCYFAGLEHTTTVTAAPFLVLGIGVDDVFVIINSYSLTFTRTSARERLTITMRDSGLSITITTLTSLISFAIGATSPYLAIRNFCLVTAAGILGGYLMCVTLFLACLSLDAAYEERRQQTHVLCCVLPVRRQPDARGGRSQRAACTSEEAASDGGGGRRVAALSGWSGLQTSGFRFSLPYTEDEKYLATARHSLLNQHATTVYECVTLQVAMAMTQVREETERKKRQREDPDQDSVSLQTPSRQPARAPKRVAKKRAAKAKAQAKAKAAPPGKADSDDLQHPSTRHGKGASTAETETSRSAAEPRAGVAGRATAKAKPKPKAKQKGVLKAPRKPQAEASAAQAPPSPQSAGDHASNEDENAQAAEAPRQPRTRRTVLEPQVGGAKQEFSEPFVSSESSEGDSDTSSQSAASPRGRGGPRVATRAADRGRRCTGFLAQKAMSPTPRPGRGGIVKKPQTKRARGRGGRAPTPRRRSLHGRELLQKGDTDASAVRRCGQPRSGRRGSGKLAASALQDLRGGRRPRGLHDDGESCDSPSARQADAGADEKHGEGLLKAQLRKLLDIAEKRHQELGPQTPDDGDTHIAEAICPVLQGKPAATVGPGAVVALAIEEQLWQNPREEARDGSIPQPKAKGASRRVRLNRRTKRIDHDGDEDSAELKGVSDDWHVACTNRRGGAAGEPAPLRGAQDQEELHDRRDPRGASGDFQDCECRGDETRDADEDEPDPLGASPKGSRENDCARPRRRHRRLDLLKILTLEDLTEPPGNVGRRLRLIVLRTIGRMLLSPWVKACLLVAFAILFAVALSGCMQLRKGLDPRHLSPDRSPLRKFFDAQEYFFNSYGDPVNIFFSSPRDICSRTFKSEYAWLHQKLESRSYTRHLVDGLHVFLSSPLGAYGPENNPLTCMRMLRSWLQTPLGENFASQFAWQGENELRAFQILLIPVYHRTSEDSSDFMTLLRKDLETFKAADAHAYNRLFVFYESDASILSSTLTNMAWAGFAVMLVSILLLPSFWSATLVVVALVLIDVAIIGFMHYWGLPLNMLTMVNLIISIGFAIDYATHICHTFCHCVGRTRDMRIFETLVLIGNPIFHGLMSTLLGVSVLAFTRSYVLRVFFKMMTLVLLLAFAHGVIFLPVVLSLIGPMGARQEPMKEALKQFARGLRKHRCSERANERALLPVD
ncbi:Sterol-sensing domain of SREBP cleavage-activation domain-containing protein [Besnoitia besnoiti]|uniref:Sterol-sensing domain of SREBP cleavage-activation domain-containing protein n=1 Tax=Besnoitia besnoiti TaxID=94643 RepID=A0A2A9M8E8_BESBE|nr:Sterol-sensing domain of SREBP cleavage-activation domain-containing protein [Besnoitia besnoiti]PFH31662.1 Sterol-sensing domain of SREBP cleavage-activation domain-containing protein [Besnoitia besnoiti]